MIYDYEKEFVKKLIDRNNAPLQVELQPGDGCGGYKCKFCYGKYQSFSGEEPIKLSEYLRFLDEIYGKTKLITLAGIKSDPLFNKDIVEIIKKILDNGFNVGIHTKGLYLTREVIDVLVEGEKDGDFITFSIDATNKITYNELHGLPPTSDVFSIVYNNIVCLASNKKKIDINVSYLLFKNNSSLGDLTNFVSMFGQYTNRIRFSIPQWPNNAESKPDFYLDESDMVRLEEDINTIKELFPQYNIVFLKFDDNKHDTTFKKCHAQKFLFTIDHYGNVYPCPQVPTGDYKHLTYGNIKEKTFEDIWNGVRRLRILNMDVCEMKCRICDRKDEAINKYLGDVYED